jgi:hypothetical protein
MKNEHHALAHREVVCRLAARKMTVYVDSANIKFRHWRSCHMTADTEKELHTMAEAIGVKREWFQDKFIPHYDISQAKKNMALAQGTLQVTSFELVKKGKAMQREAQKEK